MSLTANPAPNSPNLDIQLALVDAGGAVVAQADPASAKVTYDLDSGLDAAVSTSVALGRLLRPRRRRRVGNPLNTGYSDYASVGSYTLAQTGCVGGRRQRAGQTDGDRLDAEPRARCRWRSRRAATAARRSRRTRRECASTDGGATKTATGAYVAGRRHPR